MGGQRTKPDLEKWDGFLYSALDADVQLKTDLLRDDSWGFPE